jgi:anaphase-promoting complex subunit 10
MDSPEEDSQTVVDPDNDDSDDDDEEDDASEDDDDDDDEDDEQTVPYPQGGNAMIIRAVPTLTSLSDDNKRPLQQEVICWTLSSAKPGNGVEQLVQPAKETYWQSDGQQPHSIRIHFARRVTISHICLYLDYSLDESYTPQQVLITYGLTTQDLQPAVCNATTLSNTVIEFREPNGWCIIPLCAPPDPLDELLADDDDMHMTDSEASNNNKTTTNRPIRAHLVEISVLNMHQNGRDTHVRGVQLFGPKRPNEPQQHHHMDTDEKKTEEEIDTIRHYRQVQPEELLPTLPAFSTVGMTQFSSIR